MNQRVLGSLTVQNDLAGIVPFGHNPCQTPLAEHQHRSDTPFRHQRQGFVNGSIGSHTPRRAPLGFQNGSDVFTHTPPPFFSVLSKPVTKTTAFGALPAPPSDVSPQRKRLTVRRLICCASRSPPKSLSKSRKALWM